MKYYCTLLSEYSRQDLHDRYASSILGMSWMILQPCLTFGVFYLFFTAMPVGRISSTASDPLLFILSGFIPFQYAAECIGRAPSCVVTVPHLIKKVIFPIQIVPMSVVMVATFQLVVNLMILLIVAYLKLGFFWSLVYLPLIFLPLVAFMFAVVLFFSAIGVFVRDLIQISAMLVTALMFFSPVFYDADTTNPIMATVLQLSVLTQPIDDLRLVIIHGSNPIWFRLGVMTVGSIVALWASFKFFMMARREFADAL